MGTSLTVPNAEVLRVRKRFEQPEVQAIVCFNDTATDTRRRSRGMNSKLGARRSGLHLQFRIQALIERETIESAPIPVVPNEPYSSRCLARMRGLYVFTSPHGRREPALPHRTIFGSSDGSPGQAPLQAGSVKDAMSRKRTVTVIDNGSRRGKLPTCQGIRSKLTGSKRERCRH